MEKVGIHKNKVKVIMDGIEEDLKDYKNVLKVQTILNNDEDDNENENIDLKD